MSAFIDKMKELCEVKTPLVIMHNSNNYVVIPENLRFRKDNESWHNYCERLWVGCWKANNNDMIKLTLHLGILAKADFLNEINQCVTTAEDFIRRIDGVNPAADEHINKMRTTLFGISVAFDLCEFN